MSDRLKRMVRRLKPLQGWVDDRAITEIHIMLDGQIQARAGAGADWRRAKVAPKDIAALVDAVSSGASASSARGERSGSPRMPGAVIAEIGAHRWLSLSDPLARRGAALYVLRVRHPRMDEAALIDAGLVTQAALERVKEALREGHGVVIAGPPDSGQRALLAGLLEAIGDDRHTVLLEGFNDLDTESLSLTSLKRALIPADGVERLVFEDLVRRADCLVVEDLANDDDWRWAFAGRQRPQAGRLVSFNADTPQEALSLLIEQLELLGHGVAGQVHLRNNLNLHLLILLGSVAGGPAFQGLFEFPARGLDQEARFALLRAFDPDHAESLSGAEDADAPQASEEESPALAPPKSTSNPDLKERPLKSAVGISNPISKSPPGAPHPDRVRVGDKDDKAAALKLSSSATPAPQDRAELATAASPKAPARQTPTAGEAVGGEAVGELASGQSGSSDEVSVDEVPVDEVSNDEVSIDEVSNDEVSIVDPESAVTSGSDTSSKDVLSSVSLSEDTSGRVALSKSAPSSAGSGKGGSNNDALLRTGAVTPAPREAGQGRAAPVAPSVKPRAESDPVKAVVAASTPASLADLRENGEPLTLPSSSSRPIRQAAVKALAARSQFSVDAPEETSQSPKPLSSSMTTRQSGDESKTSEVRRAYDRLRSLSGARARAKSPHENSTQGEAEEPRLASPSTPAATSSAGAESISSLTSKFVSEPKEIVKAPQAKPSPSPPPPPTASPSLSQGPDAAARLGRRLGRPLEPRRNQTRGALFTPPPPGVGAESGGDLKETSGRVGVSSRHGQGSRSPLAPSVQKPGDGDDPLTLDVLPRPRKDEVDEEDGPTGVMNRLGSTPAQPTPPRIAGVHASPGGGRRVLSGTISRLSRRLTRPGTSQEEQKPDERGGPSTNSRRLSRYSAINRSATFKPSAGPDEALTPGALRNAKKTDEGNEDDIETIQRDTANMRPLTNKDVQNDDLDATSELDLNRVKRIIDQRNSD